MRPSEFTPMARPKAKQLTERELEVMHAFWRRGEASEDATAAQIRDELAGAGRELAYTTVATLVRILCDKGFLRRPSGGRLPAIRSFSEVSGSLVGTRRAARRPARQLLLRLLGSDGEGAAVLEEIPREKKK
jgi:predicted transcriptional regulator